MESYIKTYNNSAELLTIFETVKNKSKPLASPYAYVRDWFQAQFPDYKIDPATKEKMEKENGKEKTDKSRAEPIDIPDPECYKHKEDMMQPAA